ncbi:CpaF family protein [Bifidobacterium choloepi]|uniref:Pilus assembly protein n=1 Tax=Bifidobacterium choloepi TaxID=2614131 RepID=A0A6I5N7L4_9BIFI|nr:ATPase, T2SS/T4P/T4SS family [Bifidobacterium choloepi]NEG69841.1 pilus assembly protein [Bifidobacterium choloepi]
MSALELGPLSQLAADGVVTDIVVTCEGTIWIDRGRGMEEVRTPIPLTSAAVLRRFAVQLCAQLGCRLDDASPIADACAPDGTRVHAVIAPIVPAGAAISIRLPDRVAADLASLGMAGLCPPAWMELLRALVDGHANILVAGGTGSGKTTLLKALMLECAANERIVTVEEVRELGAVGHPHTVSLMARQPNVEGAGAVGLSQLVKATLRMRPDRIVVGECRGEEIADLLRALNSGHSGGMTTLHADGVGRVPARLAALGLLAGLEPNALELLAAGAFDVVCFMRRSGAHRFIGELGVLDLDGDEERLTGHVVASWDGHGAFSITDRWQPFAARWGGTMAA